MPRLLKIFLLLSNFLIFLASCQYSKLNAKTKNCQAEEQNHAVFTPIIQNTNALKFSANLGIMRNNFSGIMLVKQTDSLHQHIVFVNELGMKLFDFNVVNNEVFEAYVFEPLNKPALVAALKRNIKHSLLIGYYTNLVQKCTMNEQMLLKTQSANHHYFLRIKANGNLQTQYVFYKKKLESVIEYTFDNTLNTYSTILCKQQGFGNITLELQQLITE